MRQIYTPAEITRAMRHVRAYGLRVVRQQTVDEATHSVCPLGAALLLDHHGLLAAWHSGRSSLEEAVGAVWHTVPGPFTTGFTDAVDRLEYDETLYGRTPYKAFLYTLGYSVAEQAVGQTL